MSFCSWIFCSAASRNGFVSEIFLVAGHFGDKDKCCIEIRDKTYKHRTISIQKSLIIAIIHLDIWGQLVGQYLSRTRDKYSKYSCIFLDICVFLYFWICPDIFILLPNFNAHFTNGLGFSFSLLKMHFLYNPHEGTRLAFISRSFSPTRKQNYTVKKIYIFFGTFHNIFKLGTPYLFLHRYQWKKLPKTTAENKNVFLYSL